MFNFHRWLSKHSEAPIYRHTSVKNEITTPIDGVSYFPLLHTHTHRCTHTHHYIQSHFKQGALESTAARIDTLDP